MKLIDTDVFIWAERGNARAIEFFQHLPERPCISIQTYMELFQCAKTKRHHDLTRDFLSMYEITVFPFSENIGHRAAIYVEEHSLSSGLRSGDAIIAATAIENNLPLISGNAKHFRCIPNLEFDQFLPR